MLTQRFAHCIGIVAIATASGCTTHPKHLTEAETNLLPIHSSSPITAEEISEYAEMRRLLMTLYAGASLTESDEKRAKTLSAKYKLRQPAAASTESEIRSIASINTALLDAYRGAEEKHYPSRTSPPKICVALSGGGMRSAMFSYGVLRALHSFVGLDGKVDVYSATSGGGYILGWLFHQRISTGAEFDEGLFGSNKVLVGPPRYSSPFANLAAVEIWGAGMLAYLSQPPLNLLSVALQNSHSFARGGAGTSYEQALNFNFNFRGADTQWDNFSSKFAATRIGLPIWNSSSFPYRAGDGFTSLAENITAYDLNTVLMEISPLRIGSDGIGYTNRPPTGLRTIGEIVALSGSAVDFPNESFARWPTWALNAVRTGGRLRMRVAATPGYSFNAATHDPDPHYSASVYAGDGGFAENLGAFPLIKRMCETIILVDAEYDPHWIFEGYAILKQRLFMEHGIEFSVPSIDEIVKDTRGASELTSDGIAKPRPSCGGGGSNSNNCLSSRKHDTVFWEGFVGPIPVLREGTVHKSQLRVLYLKLGIPNAALPDMKYWPWAKQFSECAAKADCPFPHDRTEKIALGTDLAMAYQSLGYYGALNVACAMKVPWAESVDLEFRGQKEMARCMEIPIK